MTAETATPKTPEQLERIAAAAELVDAGHAAARAALAPGVTELELWQAAQTAIEQLSGQPAEAVVDLMGGARTAQIGLPPAEHRIAAGDPVLFDLAPRRDGYWADSCATFCCGTPSPRLRARHDVIRRALDAGLRAARPGVLAAELDAAVRTVLEDAGLTCPHHIGHGVGAAPQESPWIVPDGPVRLEQGMVVALEPGAYADGFGVRLEHLVVIEPDGGRPLTSHSLDLT